MTVKEATKEADDKSANKVAGQLENLFKTFQDVSKQDDSRKDKNFSRNFPEFSDIQEIVDPIKTFEEFSRLLKYF